MSGSVLQHAIGEAPGGSADIQAVSPGEVDPPMLQCGLELEPAPRHIAQIAAKQTQTGRRIDRGTRLVDTLLVNQHPPCQDKRLRPFARGGKCAVYQQFVQAGLHHGYNGARLSRLPQCVGGHLITYTGRSSL